MFFNKTNFIKSIFFLSLSLTFLLFSCKDAQKKIENEAQTTENKVTFVFMTSGSVEVEKNILVPNDGMLSMDDLGIKTQVVNNIKCFGLYEDSESVSYSIKADSVDGDKVGLIFEYGDEKQEWNLLNKLDVKKVGSNVIRPVYEKLSDYADVEIDFDLDLRNTSITQTAGSTLKLDTSISGKTFLLDGDTSIFYESSDESVATVDSEGIVTFLETEDKVSKEVTISAYVTKNDANNDENIIKKDSEVQNDITIIKSFTFFNKQDNGKSEFFFWDQDGKAKIEDDVSKDSILMKILEIMGLRKKVNGFYLAGYFKDENSGDEYCIEEADGGLLFFIGSGDEKKEWNTKDSITESEFLNKSITPIYKKAPTISDVSVSLERPDSKEFYYYGESVKLQTVINLLSFTERKFNWTSSDDDVATVDINNGEVTFNEIESGEDGEVVITATNTFAPSISASITLHSQIPVDFELSVENKKDFYYYGDTVQINAIFPSNYNKDKSLYYVISQDSAASIDENGLLTFKNIESGDDQEITVTAYSRRNNNVSRNINLVSKRPVEFTIYTADNNDTYYFGESIQLIAAFPANYNESQELIYESKDESVATVNNKGMVEFLDLNDDVEHEVTIRATSVQDNTKTQDIVLKSKKSESMLLKTQDGLTTYFYGDEVSVIAVLPASYTGNQNLIWESNNPSIASVNEGRVVFASSDSAGEQNIKITAKTDDQTFTASIDLCVKKIDFISFKSNNNFSVKVWHRYKADANSKTLYSTNRIEWKETQDEQIIDAYQTLNGYVLYFKGYKNVQSVKLKLQKGNEVSVSGDIMTILDAENPPETLIYNAFDGVFSKSQALTDINGLILSPMKLSDGCYQNLFSETGVKSIREDFLPAVQLTKSCYKEMFANCKSLIIPPALKNTDLPQECYSGMFKGCTGLEKVPYIQINEGKYKYNSLTSMFAECSQLSFIHSDENDSEHEYQFSNIVDFSTGFGSSTAGSDFAKITAEEEYESLFFDFDVTQGKGYWVNVPVIGVN